MSDQAERVVPAGVGREDVGLGGLGWALAATSKAARARFEALLVRAGGSFTTWKILEVLDVHGPLRQGDLAAAVGVEGPTLTRQLERLHAQDLILRQRAPDGDRRVTQIAPTAQGVALHADLRRAAARAGQEMTEGLSTEQVQALRGALDHILANLGPGDPLDPSRRETRPTTPDTRRDT